jgi:hypothetical protein
MRFQSRVRRISKPWIPYDKRQFRSGVNAAIKEMGKIAVELTSGTVSTRELRRMGHPFSRRRPQASVPKLPINKQSGNLQDAIRIVRRVRGDGEEIYLQVNSPHAMVLAKGGTSRMVPRGFFEAFAKRTQGILRTNVQKAFRKK